MPYLETCLDLFLNEKFSVKIKIFTKWPLDMRAFYKSCYNLNLLQIISHNLINQKNEHKNTIFISTNQKRHLLKERI